MSAPNLIRQSGNHDQLLCDIYEHTYQHQWVPCGHHWLWAQSSRQAHCRLAKCDPAQWCLRGGRERCSSGVLYLELSLGLQLCAISVSVPKASFSTDVNPASTHRLAMATWSAFRRAISALSIFYQLQVRGVAWMRIVYGAEYGDSCTCGTGFKMEELLKCGDFDGLASFCEQEELQVWQCVIFVFYQTSGWEIEARSLLKLSQFLLCFMHRLLVVSQMLRSTARCWLSISIKMNCKWIPPCIPHLPLHL